MNITYTYEIISVDETARCMEVVYAAEGHQTMHIGARLPYEGETLEQIVAMYAPVRFWEELKMPVVVPQVGASGVIAPVEPQAPQETTEPTAAPSSGSIPASVL